MKRIEYEQEQSGGKCTCKKEKKKEITFGKTSQMKDCTSASSKLNTTLQKLKALDSLNCEIWERLQERRRDGNFVMNHVQRIDFKGNVLEIKSEEQYIKCEPLDCHFANLVSSKSNLFNDKLPDTEYVSMKDVLDKYQMLDPLKVTLDAMLNEWKIALEKVQVYLGSIEQKVYDDDNIKKAIAETLDINLESCTVTFKPRVLHSGAQMSFSMDTVNDGTLPAIKLFLKTLLRCYEVVSESTLQGFYWEVVGAKIQKSEQNKKITKVESCHKDSSSVGSVAWNEGLHTWTLKLESPISGNTSKTQLYWMVIGVYVQNDIQNKTLPNSKHVMGSSFGICTFGAKSYFSMGTVSGSEMKIPPNSKLRLELDCDAGILSFALNDNFPYLAIKVPKKQYLSPWVHMYAAGNSVTLI